MSRTVNYDSESNQMNDMNKWKNNQERGREKVSELQITGIDLHKIVFNENKSRLIRG